MQLQQPPKLEKENIQKKYLKFAKRNCPHQYWLHNIE